ncbi:acyl-CoA dehydratase activase-related protein [Anaerofustis stercorihominis]|uniref:acyl-CoA dehydratase activase-related protein n=1 Tax=Anaerofustis stercorihominis TaxID=214853 RepID=UPI0039841AD8
MERINKLGIDIGSTTVKVAIMDTEDNILYSKYERHFANIQDTLLSMIKEALEIIGDCKICPVITGSGGLSLSSYLDIPFVQEVVAVSTVLRKFHPTTDVAIEIGGEDAKIIYFEGTIEQRMNGICAGGTGSFIDQMASLLKTDANGLNELAKGYENIYPIAARCGVFAKSDIQPLINEGATRENLAASIFQAVVNQTISGLACGKPIRGNVAFLGGPLYFMSELKEAFIRTLGLKEENVISPKNPHLFAAIGAALSSEEEDGNITLSQLKNRLDSKIKLNSEIKRMERLFEDSEDYKKFSEEHAVHTVEKGSLKDYKGNCYLGIDAGSTTTKLALCSEDGKLLYSFYSNNNGSVLETTVKALKDIYSRLPKEAKIVYSCSTGYGEDLVKSAFMLDEGEVETIAHYYAASFFDPKVDCILDIGGQDMKCIKIKDGSVDNVLLNEACSSGCGSFIETFAKSLGYSVEDFAKEALFAKNPIDLGTRCTVFMNSNVKQAQKEGAPVSDISAGLAYSVIKNALYKIIKLTNPDDLGKHVVVQGGTFYNDAVLRAFEKISGHAAVRPDIAGIMGAFGAALIAKERYEEGKESTMLDLEKVEKLTYTTMMTRCKGCTNNCYLTINSFDGGKRKFITGNRCERGAGIHKDKSQDINLFDYKNEITFGYEPLREEEAVNGVIGIPRVLNMFENYPFWATLFKELKFRVELSPVSTRKIYEYGIESIPSESECYPAKLTHGHVTYLIRKGIKTIFYPCIPYERNETPDAGNHYNCPIVTSYAENIKNNVEEIETEDVKFLNPFLAFTNKETAKEGIVREFTKGGETGFDLDKNEVSKAVDKAWAELMSVRDKIAKKGEEVVKYLDETGKRGIVLAGRPYHIDPEVNHGIDKMINSYGIAVLTEDSVSHLAEVERPLIVTDQWMYHSRLYKAANFIKTKDNIDLVQLNSFGCGLDAVTVDGVRDILSSAGKIHTVLKIDEVNNLGAARIRIRSLLATLKIRDKKKVRRKVKKASYQRVEFTKDMKKEYTILSPQMSPIHFSLFEAALNSCGYKYEALKDDSKHAVDIGLKYVNNDACYPSLIVVGQIMEALNSGKYDTDKVAIMITQTGGGCRATNYIGFIRRALENAGMGHIPVVSLNANGIETNEGFKITPKLLNKALQAVVYGDLFMRVLYRMRPYEVVKGSADMLHRKWEAKCIEDLSRPRSSKKLFNENIRNIIREFDELPITNEVKPKVGIVGEILVKFLPGANNHLVDLIEKEGAETVMPDLLDFLLYCFYNNNFKSEKLGMKKMSARISNIGINFVETYRKAYKDACAKSVHFTSPNEINKLAYYASDVVSVGNQTGEGWFLTGEILELIKTGVNNIVCAQPFGCLPNHVVGKGVIKKIREMYPMSNIVAIDYDPGASEVNQLNRIKLMLSQANMNLKEIPELMEPEMV